MARKPVIYCLVDAFTDTAFKGNPAAVCLLEEEEDRDDHWLQAVAREFNQPITCYLTRLSASVSDSDKSSIPCFRIRWFTPILEVQLCGHATLAASHFLFTHPQLLSSHTHDTIHFSSLLSGILTATTPPCSQSLVSNSNPTIQLDFPAFTSTKYHAAPVEASSFFTSLGCTSPIIEILTSSSDFILVLPSGEAVSKVVPNFGEMMKFPGRGVIITAISPPASGFDFITRFFSPKEGIDEDQVCGSAHCALAPYWSKKLGKCDLIAYQASKRGGVLKLHVDEKNQRVWITGKGITVMEGSLFL